MTLPPPPSHRYVARFHGHTALFLGLVAAYLVALQPLTLVGGAAPGFPASLAPTETGGYLGATGGAFAAALALLCGRVARDPTRSTTAWPALCAAFFGLAWVRYIGLFFGDALPAVVGLGMAAEVIVFSVVGTLAGTARTDASTTLRGLAMQMAGSLPRLPVHLKLWLPLLVVVVVAAPFAFLDHRGARMLALGHVLNLAGFVLYGAFGLRRILGVSHLYAWTPALVVIALEALSGTATGAYAGWAWAAFGVGGVCLLIDALDTVRFALGDRSELVPGYARVG